MFFGNEAGKLRCSIFSCLLIKIRLKSCQILQFLRLNISLVMAKFSPFPSIRICPSKLFLLNYLASVFKTLVGQSHFILVENGYPGSWIVQDGMTQDTSIYSIYNSMYSIYDSIYSITRALAATAQVLFDPTSLVLIRNMEVNPTGFSRSNNFCSEFKNCRSDFFSVICGVVPCSSMFTGASDISSPKLYHQLRIGNVKESIRLTHVDPILEGSPW